MWENISNFVVENWKLIAAAIIFMFFAAVAIISGKKKGLSFAEIISGIISEQLPHWITAAEKDGGTGEHKKVQVLNEAVNYAAKKMGRKLTEEETSLIVAKASEYIESILSTPQKKELGPDEAPKKSKYR